MCMRLYENICTCQSGNKNQIYIIQCGILDIVSLMSLRNGKIKVQIHIGIYILISENSGYINRIKYINKKVILKYLKDNQNGILGKKFADKFYNSKNNQCIY